MSAPEATTPPPVAPAAAVVPPMPAAPLIHIRIRPGRGGWRNELRELWAYRELLYFLVWRDVKVRYKQTAIGAAWAIIQPLAMMLPFWIFFGKLAKVPSDDIPYPLFAFAGLIPWQLFSFSLTESANSLVNNKNLITKIYFPRIIVPLAAVAVGLVDFVVAFGVLLLMLGGYLATGAIPPPGAAVLLLPAFVALAVLTALGVGLWLSALNVRYRDVRYTLGFLAQFWLLVTPVAYPASLAPERWRWLFGLNPMSGVVEGFRWALLDGPPPGPLLAVALLMVAALLASGWWYFRQTERTFADLA